MKFSTKYLSIIIIIFLIFVLYYGYSNLENNNTNKTDILDTINNEELLKVKNVDTLNIKEEVMASIKDFYNHTDSVLNDSMLSFDQLLKIKNSITDFNEYVDYFTGYYEIQVDYKDLDSTIQNRIDKKIRFAKNQPQHKYHIIIGSFKIKQNALNYKNKFSEGDFNPYIITNNGFHCVSLTNHYSVDEAVDHVNFLKNNSIHKNVWVLRR